jgi:Skp family chaperone for outer membrane proteins
MKVSSLKSLLFVGLAGFGVLGAQAQPAPKIAVVDLTKLLENYWQTNVEINKINAEKAKDQVDFDAMVKDRNDLIAKFNQLYSETSNNPAITTEAKAKAEAQLKDLNKTIVDKGTELQTVSTNINDALRNEFNNYKKIAIQDITDTASKIAQKHLANLLIDRSNSTMYQTSTFLFIATDYPDLTDEVLKELNRDHPVTAPAVSTVPDATAPKTGDKVPSVTFPAPK